MIEREKVMRGLTQCSREHRGLEDCAGCPYKLKPGHYAGLECWCRLCDDALFLLKEQEPRVLTLEEAESLSDGVWTEIWSPSVREYCLIYARVSKNNNFSDYENLEEDSGTGWIRDRDYYNKNVDSNVAHGWRCWTSRPTEEQRKAVKWDE